MHTNGSGPTFSSRQLKSVSIGMPILVAGYQADTSNSIELNAEPGTSPISRVIHKMMEQPLNVSMLQAHPAGQMASAYTHFTNLDTHDPLYRYTMGMRVTGGEDLPDDVGMVEVPPGTFLALEVSGPFHSTIPAAWTWLLNQFADSTIPWRRTFAGDVELYTFGPDADDSICTIYVAVEPVG
jgi:predicted transcriptional regulator YdeE